MVNKKNALVVTSLLGFLLLTNVANAASGRGGVSNNKHGIFVGFEYDYESLLYTHYIWDNIDKEVAQINVPSTTKTTVFIPYITLGARYYFNQYVGIGIKGWAGQNDQYSNTSVYDAYWDGKSFGKYTIKANGVNYGIEAQSYLDFINVGSKLRTAVGITLGIGYELSRYTYINTETTYDDDWAHFDNRDTGTNYNDGGVMYDAALHFTLNEHNRLELGYKIKQHNTTTIVTVSDPDTTGNGMARRERHIGFNFQNAIYASYSYML